MGVKTVQHTSVCAWEAWLIYLLVFSGSWKKTLELPSTQAEDLVSPEEHYVVPEESNSGGLYLIDGTLKQLWGGRRCRNQADWKLNIQEGLLGRIQHPRDVLRSPSAGAVLQTPVWSSKHLSGIGTEEIHLERAGWQLSQEETAVYKSFKASTRAGS